MVTCWGLTEFDNFHFSVSDPAHCTEKFITAK